MYKHRKQVNSTFLYRVRFFPLCPPLHKTAVLLRKNSKLPIYNIKKQGRFTCFLRMSLYE
ncbi:hypothetical protein QSI_2030 [Clostridioides difficile P28]|nr:hypothetical protein QSI_2030 [Clostridioides difficile P28]